MTAKQLEQQNNVLQKKLKKYKHTYFGPLYILSISIIYLICQIFNVDNFFRIFPNIQNSLTFTLMGSFVLGMMLGVCKIEYNNSVRKIRKEIIQNKEKIRIAQKKQSNVKVYEKKIQNKPTNNKRIEAEIEQIKKQETIKSVEKILQEKQKTVEPIEVNENTFDDIDFIQTVDEIDISKIKEKVLQKRLEK
jgi:hypothetical protein